MISKLIYFLKRLFKWFFGWFFRSPPRVILLIFIIWTILSELLVRADTYSIYDTNVSSTALSYFEGVMSDKLTDDYVIWRNGQYEYCLAYGSLEYSDSSIVGTGGITVLSYTISSSSGKSVNSVSSVTDNSFVLSVSDEPLYSNLDNYSDVVDREGVVLIVAVAILSCYLFTRYMFNSLFVD